MVPGPEEGSFRHVSDLLIGFVLRNTAARSNRSRVTEKVGRSAVRRIGGRYGAARCTQRFRRASGDGKHLNPRPFE